jgi:hypothetical protein
MHVVAVVRWGPPLQQELPALAARLGVVAYDLRLRLAGGLPAVFVRVEDGNEANAQVEFLRARGHGAVALDVGSIPGPETQLVPVDFEQTAAALRGATADGARFEIPYGEIVAAIHAACVTSSEHAVTTKEKKFSAGLAVATGGLVVRKNVQRVEKERSEDEERVMYLFCRSSPTLSVWRERTLRYDSLGNERALTQALNFAVFSKKLRAHVPAAFHDERLVAQKRHSDIASFSFGAKERRIETSNERQNDLAAFLLFRGFLERQL